MICAEFPSACCLDPHVCIIALRRITGPEKDNPLSIFASHPMTADRMAMLEAAGGAPAGEPLLSFGVAGLESDLQIGQNDSLPMARGREPIQTVRAIGLMSGTSMDGVDVAIIETDGQEIVTLGRTGFFPYAEANRALLRRAAGDAACSMTAMRGRAAWRWPTP
jgi:Anhydro-N-acetylmuramic acid kinase